jgi:hypothetical protein
VHLRSADSRRAARWIAGEARRRPGNAAAGVVIAALPLTGCVAVLHGRSHRLLAASRTLAWLRLTAIPVAVATIAAVIGLTAVTGLTQAFIIGLTLLLAACGAYSTGSAHRLASAGQ